MYLYYVKLLICTTDLIPGPELFLGAFPPPCLSSPIRPILPLLLTSSSPSPNLDRPVPTTSGTPSPPASKRTAHRGPELVASQYTAQPFFTSSWCMFQSPRILLPPLIPPIMGTTKSHPPRILGCLLVRRRATLCWKLLRSRSILGFGNHVSTLSKNTTCVIALKKCPDTFGSAPSRIKIRDNRP